MATSTRRPLDPTPLYAVVGVTDLAVQRVRAAARSAGQAQAEAQKALNGFDPRAVATEAPNRAVAAALSVAGKAEEQYGELAQRGRTLYERVRTQQSTQDLFNQAGNTLSRGRGAVTTARRAADDTATAVRGTIGVGRREAENAATTTTTTSAQATRSAATSTRTAAKKSATRARKDAATTKSAVKGVRTSAKKTASKAGTVAKDSIDKVGD